MDKKSQIMFDASFRSAMKQANAYFNVLTAFLNSKEYRSVLEKDFTKWEPNHVPKQPFSSIFKKSKKDESNISFYEYIETLYKNGKLDAYLERSIAYVYIRDLGYTLKSPDVQKRIHQQVASIKRQLNQSQVREMEKRSAKSHLVKLHQIAKREGVETSFIWSIDKLSYVSRITPEQLDATSVQRKLVKVIAGVVQQAMETMDKAAQQEERSQRLDQAIRIGYSYGLTYPFIDDLLDSEILTAKEKDNLAALVRDALLLGRVPNLGSWPREHEDWLRSIYAELRAAFLFLKNNIEEKSQERFSPLAYVFFQSQEIDRAKKLENPNYTNEELYSPIILKSAYSRLIIPPMMNDVSGSEVSERIFYSGIFNQLADDLNDLLGDWKDRSVTPFTYYLEHHESRPDLINPWELYWVITYYLIHHVYGSNPKTSEVLLERAINVQQRFKNKLEESKYKEIMSVLAPEDSSFHRLIQKLIQRADNVDFMDRGIVQYMDDVFKKEQEGKKDFLATIKKARDEVNSFLTIVPSESTGTTNSPIIDAANYSLSGSGKRLRPIMAYVMGVKGYGLDPVSMEPLLKSLEYMHTASLIFDDLPAQDNASIRRGKPTLHIVFNEAIAELTGLFMMMKSVEEQASLQGFDAEIVLELIQYSTRMTQEMSIGQVMDLHSTGKKLTLDQLKELSYYKTSLGFEASLMMPAILAQAGEAEKQALKKFTHHAGLVFQIKDDLLDVQGDSDVIGKPVGLDAENNQVTFPSLLGIDEAINEMWNHYFQAVEVLREVPRNTEFLAHLLDYFINRQY